MDLMCMLLLMGSCLFLGFSIYDLIKNKGGDDDGN